MCLRRPLWRFWAAIAVAPLALASCTLSTDDGGSAGPAPSTTASTAFTSTSFDTATSTPNRPPRPGCAATPPKSDQPLAWLPADLPLPQGSFAAADLTQSPPTYQAILVVPGTLVSWVQHVNATWPQAGWVQGRGESEMGEVENTYARLSGAQAGQAEGGAWRVRDAYCDKQLIELLLIYRK